MKIFYEVYVKCSVEECIRRDPNGLYKRALAGNAKHVMGVDDPYEVPTNPDLVINTEELNIGDSIAMIHTFIDQIG